MRVLRTRLLAPQSFTDINETPVVTWGVSSFPAAAATRCTAQPKVLFRLRGLPGQIDAADAARTPPAGDTSLLRAAVKSILYTSRAVERELASA